MSQIAKLLFKILRGLSDADIRFEELRNLLLRLGFAERVRGSHHIFRKQGIEEKINLQQDGDKAKSYQVKQVRKILVRYKLGGKL
jgi:predicted RNA binding protein YcfA (HicA-like mRNA interferase family)